MTDEWEAEGRSRRFNLAEALGVMASLLAVLWFIAYPLGVVGGVSAASEASRAGIAGLLVFALVLSPWLHGDTAKSRGLGSLRELLHILRHARPAKRFGLLGAIGLLTGLLTLELYRYAVGADRLILGIEPDLRLHLERTLGGKGIVLLAGVTISLAWATILVRYDNFLSAFKAAVTLLTRLLPLVFLVAWVANGPDSFRVAKPADLLLNGLGYMFWGAAQQLVFCSYFNTRLRKAFAPAAGHRPRAARRLGVALLSGFFFGLVHLNNWLLVGFAWLLGTLLSWFFMEDRYRNLQALGFVHGCLGTCILWLFAQNNQGIRIRLLVGPWGLRHQWDPALVAVPALLILSFTVLLTLAWRMEGSRR